MNKKVHLLKYCEELVVSLSIFIFSYFILALCYILYF